MVNEANEIKELCIKQFAESDMFDYMGEKEFVLFKKLFSFMDASTNLLIEQAELMDSIDEKLTKLLAAKV